MPIIDGTESGSAWPKFNSHYQPVLYINSEHPNVIKNRLKKNIHFGTICLFFTNLYKEITENILQMKK